MAMEIKAIPTLKGKEAEHFGSKGGHIKATSGHSLSVY